MFSLRGATQNRTKDKRIFSNFYCIVITILMIDFIVLTLYPFDCFCFYLYPFIQKMVTYWSHGNDQIKSFYDTIQMLQVYIIRI